jgi:type IV secretory pathway VirB3-like protein
MEEQPLDEEAFDMAATRPPLTFGLPYKLCAILILVGIVGLFVLENDDLVTSLIMDAVWVGAIAMIWTAAKIMLRTDYHGWDIFVSWLTLDARFFDTKEWGGSHLSSFPQRSIYRCGMRDNADQ